MIEIINKANIPLRNKRENLHRSHTIFSYFSFSHCFTLSKSYRVASRCGNRNVCRNISLRRIVITDIILLSQKEEVRDGVAQNRLNLNIRQGSDRSIEEFDIRDKCDVEVIAMVSS